MSDRIRVVFAEDHPLFREGLRSALTHAADLELVGEATDGAAALALIRSERPEVAILDIGLPEMDGCAVARRVRQ